MSDPMYTWTTVFDRYYQNLSRLTGLTGDLPNRRPKVFSALTKEFVYDRLSGDLPEDLQCLKDGRTAVLGFKLQQTFSVNGASLFFLVMKEVIAILESSETVEAARESFALIDQKLV